MERERRRGDDLQMKHIDTHIHIERGEYTLEWIKEFVKTAFARGIDEIWLLEHCYQFCEFIPMYEKICNESEFVNKWLHRKYGVLGISDYMNLVETVRKESFPVEIKFGLEMCYFQHAEDFTYAQTKDLGLDFLVGSVHFIDDFAFDHTAEHWENVDVDKTFCRNFEIAENLAKSGLYSGIAHPDCVKLFGHSPSFPLEESYDNLAKQLAKKNMYAEMNSGCYRRANCEIGMAKGMIKAMRRHGVKIVTASDAHCPEDVGMNIKQMEELLSEIQ
jgi:Histidinol phosphatase and related hydrolases of the PHP family